MKKSFYSIDDSLLDNEGARLSNPQDLTVPRTEPLKSDTLGDIKMLIIHERKIVPHQSSRVDKGGSYATKVSDRMFLSHGAMLGDCR